MKPRLLLILGHHYITTEVQPESLAITFEWDIHKSDFSLDLRQVFKIINIQIIFLDMIENLQLTKFHFTL